MEVVNYILDLDDMVLSAERPKILEGINSWTDFYEDDGDALLAKANVYEDYKDFEKVYFNDYGTTPLHHAIKSNKASIVRKVLLKGANVNHLDNLSIAPLYYSILLDNEEIVELLLNNGADAKGSFVENSCQLTYFQRVCETSNWKIVRLFLNYGCDANEVFTSKYCSSPEYSRPLHVAVLHRRLETMKILLRYHAQVNDINKEGETPLHIACTENFVEAVELLLNNNALVNIYAKNNTTPLYQGIRCGNYKIVELLLLHGALIESENTVANIHDPLHMAIAAGYLKIVEDLLSHGLNVNMKSASAQNDKDPAFLHTAVENEQIEIVHLFLKFNAEINIKDGFGRTPLHIAAINENEVMIELLLQYDPDLKVSPENSTLHAVDKDGSTPLHNACKGRSIDCVQHLIENGSDINAENFKGETPLHFACEVGELNIIKLLIKNKASINASTEDYVTPLHVAVKHAHEKTVEMLLMNEAITTNKDKDKKIPLKLAVENADMKIIELLLQYNPDVNNKYYKRVFFEVLELPKTYGHEMIECFFKYGFIISKEDRSNEKILIKTISNGYFKIFEQLLADGLDVNSIVKGESMLHIATKNMYCDIVNLLIKNGANLYATDQFGKIPIFYAIENNDKMLVEIFLNSGVDVKIYPELLHYTIIKCSNKCKDIIEILLQHGADINYCDDHGVNAVHLVIQFLRKDIRAEQYNHTKLHDYVITSSVIDTVKFLLEKGVNVNAKTKFGWTALHMAIVLDDNLEKLVETLLDYDADADCKNELGNTPLHLSCQKANFTVISILLNHGANVNIEDATGKTPLDAVFKIKNDYQKKAEKICAAVFLNCVEDLINSYFLTRTYIDFCNDAVLIFQNHITKMNTAGLYLSPKNMKYLHDRQASFEAECEKEISDVKELKLNNYVSVYDILVKDLTEVARYTKNEKIQEVYTLLESPVKFPKYGPLILHRLKKAVRRQSFVNRAMEALNFLSGFWLPESCTENIIIYLKNEELKNLADTLPPQDTKMEVSD